MSNLVNTTITGTAQKSSVGDWRTRDESHTIPKVELEKLLIACFKYTTARWRNLNAVPVQRLLRHRARSSVKLTAIPDSVDPIFDVTVVITGLDEVLDDTEVLKFSGFETFGIVEDEAAIVG